MTKAELITALAAVGINGDAVKDKTNAELEAMLQEQETGDTIAPGKAICTKRGILGEGEPVTAEDLNGGEQTLDDLKAKGYII